VISSSRRFFDWRDRSRGGVHFINLHCNDSISNRGGLSLLSLLSRQQWQGTEALPGDDLCVPSPIHRPVASQIDGIARVPFKRIEEPHDIKLEDIGLWGERGEGEMTQRGREVGQTLDCNKEVTLGVVRPKSP
jgi:hypothetical protein